MTGSIFYNVFFDLFIVLLILIFSGLTYIATIRGEPERYKEFTGLKPLIIIPCKGEDYSLRENLASIVAQDHPNYKAIAVVDSPDDPALRSITTQGIEWMLSQDICTNCSGKVRAIATAVREHPDYDLYVIADSDILVARNWLSRLMSPFGVKEVGISTTFPYFNPVGGFWSKVKLVWGFVGLGMMESKLTRFGWGGSLAFRRELLDGSGLDFFKSYVSDDIALTKLCKKNGKKIAYVSDAMPRVNSPDDFRTFMEWANRQTALSIYSTRNVFYFGVIFYGASILLFISAIVMTILMSPWFVILLIPAIINSVRAVRRAGRWPLASFLISLLIPFIYLYNLVKASRMNKITWRGSEYSLDGDAE